MQTGCCRPVLCVTQEIWSHSCALPYSAASSIYLVDTDRQHCCSDARVTAYIYCFREVLCNRQHVQQLGASVWIPVHQDGLTAASYAPDRSQICLMHTFFKADLLAALRQALPTGGVTVCDITEWISTCNVAAQMMVHSMLDAGKLLADLYSKCPQLARGATVLTVYGEHVAAVKQLLCSCLCDVHEDPQLLQRIAHLETQVYKQISDTVWAEGSCISTSSAFSNSHLLATSISNQHRAWLAAGDQMLQSRHRQHQQNTAARAKTLQAKWNDYLAKQRDEQRAYEQAEANYKQKLQEVHDKAASLLDQCRAFAAKDTVSAEHLAGSVMAAYAGASKRFLMLKQKPLLPAAHGFEEVQDRLIDIRLQAGTAGFKKSGAGC